MGIISNYFVSMARLLSEMISTFELIDLKQNNVENGKCDEKVFLVMLTKTITSWWTLSEIQRCLCCVFFLFGVYLACGNCWHGTGLR